MISEPISAICTCIFIVKWKTHLSFSVQLLQFSTVASADATWLIWLTFCFRRSMYENNEEYELSHESMTLFVLRKLILQARMRSHPVGLDVCFLFGRILRLLPSFMCANSLPVPSLVAYLIKSHELAHTIVVFASSIFYQMKISQQIVPFVPYGYWKKSFQNALFLQILWFIIRFR